MKWRTLTLTLMTASVTPAQVKQLMTRGAQVEVAANRNEQHTIGELGNKLIAKVRLGGIGDACRPCGSPKLLVVGYYWKA